ncbi:hypothetical protein B0H14DRAFT_2643153 [Mycena olivaceomarginata]|nr:hypothetical protein B0H14DRAFT_2643153 [Mycena olivaceomarginata]
MYSYYADYDDYDDQYHDDAAGYDPPEASYDTYDSELSYELKPDTEPHNSDYPVYEGMSDGREYESELVEQGSWEEPRYALHHALCGSDDGCMPRELEDASFDAPALDESYAAWQETWATGPAPDEDEDAWVQAMDSWREQIEADHGADVREDLAYACLPDGEPAVGDDIWTSPEREQLQEAFERGVISGEEYVRVLRELWDEQLELEQLDERLRADGYVWEERCNDYVHPVYGHASLEPDDEDVELPLTPLDHMHLGHSLTLPPAPALPVPVPTLRPSYRRAGGPKLNRMKPASAIHLLRIPKPQAQCTPTPAALLPHTVIPIANVASATSRARAGSDPGPRPGKLKPPDTRMPIATVSTPTLSVAPMLTQPQARLSPQPVTRCVDTAVIPRLRKPPNIGEVFQRAVPL